MPRDENCVLAKASFGVFVRAMMRLALSWGSHDVCAAIRKIERCESEQSGSSFHSLPHQMARESPSFYVVAIPLRSHVYQRHDMCLPLSLCRGMLRLMGQWQILLDGRPSSTEDARLFPLPSSFLNFPNLLFSRKIIFPINDNISLHPLIRKRSCALGFGGAVLERSRRQQQSLPARSHFSAHIHP